MIASSMLRATVTVTGRLCPSERPGLPVMTVAATWPLGRSMAVLVTGCGVLRMTGQVSGCGHAVADVGGVAGFHLATAVGDRTAARPAEAATELSIREVMASVRCGHDRTG